jgi:peptidoglycan/xylan/chitin deacetylase (PgdA/CDA1 family)
VVLKIKIMRIILIMAIVSALITTALGQVNNEQKKYVAFTIDDLPVVEQKDRKARKEITKKLLSELKKEKVPAIGFVNESKLYKEGKLEKAEIALLKEWTKQGFELGNHTYSHINLNTVEFEAYKEDVLKGEIVTKDLLNKAGKKMEYFRHPYLRAGMTKEIKEAVDSFLFEKGYKIAPVTIDNSDYIFSSVYDKALAKGDIELAAKIAESYLAYTDSSFAYYEKLSIRLFSHDIKQVLLIHANRLNADVMFRLIQMMKRRGYEFISLSEALKDKAYQSEDRFYSKGGVSWIYRWAITQGRKGDFFKEEPEVPEEIMKMYKE